MKKRVGFSWKNALLFTFCIVFIIACLWRPISAGAVAKPALGSQTLTLNKKQSKTIKIKNVKKSRIKKVTYKSSKKSVAKVSSKGKVIGMKAGKAVITCKVTLKSGKKYTLKCRVTVKKKNSAKKKPTVYMTKDISSDGLMAVYDENGEIIIPENEPMVHTVSCDEKPGIQAIATTGDDLRPAVETGCVYRDAEYKHLGTLSLLAGIDILTGIAIHKSSDFINLLKKLDGTYPKEDIIRIVCDNHSAHKSKETRSYLATLPEGLFVFVFTPKHGSWLNLVVKCYTIQCRTAKTMMFCWSVWRNYIFPVG